MTKAIFIAAFACLSFLILGTFLFPDNAVMWLVNMSADYTVFRVITATVLLIAICTTPPRKLAVRLVLAAVALGLAVFGVHEMLSDSMQLLDMALFFILAVSFGLISLELDEDEILKRCEAIEALYSAKLPMPVNRASLTNR